MYLYRKNSLKRKVHIAGSDGLTLCKVENGSKKILDSVKEIPGDRKMCGVCQQLHRGGITKASRRERVTKGPNLYTSYEWAELRYRAFKEYGAKCVVCGTTDNLTVDHIKPAAKYPELRLDLTNLQVMCRLCNRGKGRWDETDWRSSDGDLTPEQAAHMREILQ